MSKNSSVIILLATGFMIASTPNTVKAAKTGETVKKIKDLKGELAWEKLMLGNDLFLEHTYPKTDPRLSKNQTPYTIVLSCSDSRVSPEIIFDEKLGKIFAIRVAGHVLDDAVIASIEYGVEKLKAPLLVIIGHENCGAINAAIKDLKANKGVVKSEPTQYIDRIIIPIENALKEADIDLEKPDASKEAIRANVVYTTQTLLYKSDKVYKAFKSKNIKIVGAEFLSSGKVNRLF